MPDSQEKMSIDAALQQYRKTKDKKYKNYILSSLDKTINSAIKSYAGGDLQLRTQAKILASKAIDSYSPERGTKLSTYIHSSLRPLSRIRDKRKTAVYLPENVRFDSRTVYRFIDRVRDLDNREPSLQEISDNTGFSIKRINKALQEGREKATSELQTDKGEIITQQSEKDRNFSDIWQDYIYYDLDPVNQKIFEWSTGYKGSPKKDKKTIAKDLNLSAPAISQRLNTISKRFEEALKPVRKEQTTIEEISI